MKSYVPPFELGEPMQGGAVGKVVESRSPELTPSATPSSTCSAGARRRPARRRGFNKVPPLPVEDHQWLGNLGLTGGTAYFGLLRVAAGEGGRHRLRLGGGRRGRLGGGADRQGQGHDRDRLGRRRGEMRLGALARRRCGDRLQGRADRSSCSRRAAPKGIDVYFDNVGGDHLDAAFAAARQNARFAICGMIDDYNTGSDHAFRYIMRMIADAASAEGLHLHRLSGRNGRILPRHGRPDRRPGR